MSKTEPIWDVEDGAVDGEGIGEAITVLDAYSDVPFDDVNPAQENARRAWRAALAVQAYGEQCGTGYQESARTCMSDLLNDMRHLCDALAIDWDDVSRPYHYVEEIAEAS